MKVSRSINKILVIIYCFVFVILISGMICNFIYNNSKTETVVVYNTKVYASSSKMLNRREYKSFMDITISVVSSIDILPKIVYDGMTMDELANKLDRVLKSDLTGKGYLFASYSLDKGVDPYLAVAISLHETGCAGMGCSSLVKSCNNVGGMRGSGCNGWGYFDTLDNGIMAFIDNISNNYVAYGLTTAEAMNPKYAASPTWANVVNYYIERIRNS